MKDMPVTGNPMPHTSRPLASAIVRTDWQARAIASILTTVLALTSVAPPAKAQIKSGEESVIRMNGSSTIGSKMALELATAWARQHKIPSVRVEAGNDTDEYTVIGQTAESAQTMRVFVQSKGTGFGLEPMLRGQIDFWVASRQILESDLEAMRKRGVPNVPTYAQMTQPGIENVIALGAMAVIVNQRNPVPSLTFAQLRDMYAGKVTSWAQVGGPSNLPIGLISPEPTLATADFFCTSVIGNKDTLKCMDSFARLATPRILLMEDVSDAVAANTAGVSFVDFSARRGARPVAVGSDCGAPVEPSQFRIKTDEYPLTRKHYFYISPNRPLSPAAKDFLQLTVGPVGQAAAVAAGLTNLSPAMSDVNYASDRLDTVRDAMDGGRTRIRAGDARAFATATANADRLSITFRFQTGTNDLDSRAEADLGRLVALMQLPNYSQMAVSLIGYSGVAGEYEDDRVLSQDRAEAVRIRLKAAGLQNVTAVGVGPAGAIACNLDPKTTVQNQRVEVWLRKRPM